MQIYTNPSETILAIATYTNGYCTYWPTGSATFHGWCEAKAILKFRPTESAFRVTFDLIPDFYCDQVHIDVSLEDTTAGIVLFTKRYDTSYSIEFETYDWILNSAHEFRLEIAVTNDSLCACPSGGPQHADITVTLPAEEPVYFADPNLKAAVEQELGKTNPTTTDMLSLTYLFAWQMSIDDLTGLEYATNLQDLYLDYNQISNIGSLSGLSNLQNLGLERNKISNIQALSGLTNLRHLYLDYNQISNIQALSGLTNLNTLGLEDN